MGDYQNVGYEFPAAGNDSATNLQGLAFRVGGCDQLSELLLVFGGSLLRRGWGDYKESVVQTCCNAAQTRADKIVR